MSTGTFSLWRLFPTVRRMERERFLFFFAISALISLGQTIGISCSEALFLARIGPSGLPWAMTLASLVTVAGSLVYSYWVGRVHNAKLFVFLLTLSVIGLAITAFGIRLGVPGMFTSLFCGFYLLQAVLVNLHFWTFAADFFDTLVSKRLFPLFALGASVGGVIGGTLAATLSGWLGADTLIIVWAIPLLIAAVLIHGARRNLARWSPVGQVEADESSTAAMRGALQYLSRSSLARWLVASVVGLVFSMILIQFVYLEIFTEAFPQAEALAAFLGIYLAVSNLIEIAVGVTLTQWLIPRFGVARAGAIHPILTLFTFVGLIFDPRLHVAVLARVNRELLENSLAAPLRSLTYNALSYRFRGRMRAFLEGIVFNAGMALAGIALLVLEGSVDVTGLCLVGLAAGLLYLLASLRVRREYLRSLVTELRTGRLDLRDVQAEMGAGELQGIADQWQALAVDPNEFPSRVLLELAPMLAQHGLTTHLEAAASSPHSRVRIACLTALSEHSLAISDELLATSLRDADTSVRLGATAAAGRMSERSEMLDEALRERLVDEDAAVRAEAAVHSGADGLTTLGAMAASADPRVAIEALERLPIGLLDSARERLHDEDAGVHAAALHCWSRLLPATPLGGDELVDDLHHTDPRVRRAAAQALGARGSLATLDEDRRSAALAGALDDLSREVRREAGQALVAMGDSGLRATEPLVAGLRLWTVDAALSTIAKIGTQRARAVLQQAYRANVLRTWELAISINVVSAGDDLAARFLAIALDNAMLRSRWLAFRILELLEDPAVVRSVQKALRRNASRERGDALEVLTYLADREASSLLALLLEAGPIEDKLATLTRSVSQPQDSSEVIGEAADSDDRWLRMAAERILSKPDSLPPEEERLMEGLLALRGVPLFAHLTLEQLETISQLMRPVEYLAGEIMMNQGDPGEELYVLLEGEARAYRNYGTDSQVYLSTMRPVSYIGEIAILDQAARSATVLVTEDSRLLTLGAEPFRELIIQTPEISFEVFRVLTERIRSAERRDAEPEG